MMSFPRTPLSFQVHHLSFRVERGISSRDLTSHVRFFTPLRSVQNDMSTFHAGLQWSHCPIGPIQRCGMH